MNWAHDMGGVAGFGLIQAEPESTEPVFHAEWERRVYGLTRVLGVLGKWNLDMSRHARERQAPEDYLKHTYYENWLVGLETLLLETGLVTEEEITTGAKLIPVPEQLEHKVLRADGIAAIRPRRADYLREVSEPPRFKKGDAVRAINRQVVGHTREPGYVRNHVGTVQEHYGAQVFPDLRAKGVDQGEHLYGVCFGGEELWGTDANTNSTVHLNLWQEYLELAK